MKTMVVGQMAKKKRPEEHENLERWLVSYGDFITLLFATFVVLYALAQVDATDFAKLEESLKNAREILGYAIQKCAADHTSETTVSVVTLPNDDMKGRLIGGGLDILVNLCGTRFDKVTEFNDKYKDDGIIWFLESCDLNMLSYRRAMWELDEAGWFTNTKGFIIGRPLHFGENIMGLDQYKAVYDVLSKYKVPIIMDADLGHLPPAIPIISGSMATVRAGEGKWEIDMEFK